MNALPEAARAALDARLGEWRTAEVLASEWMWADPPMSPAVIWGDFDGDERLDWAAQIVAALASERQVYVFLDRVDSMETLLLVRGGSERDALYLVNRGEERFDSSAAGGRGAWARALRDAIGVIRGDSAEWYEIEEEPDP